MGNVEILLHHRAGAADLVADHGAELRQQQIVHGALDLVAFGLVLRRDVGVSEFSGVRARRAAAMVLAAARMLSIGGAFQFDSTK